MEVDKARRIGRNKIWKKCQWAWVSFAVQVMESQPRALNMIGFMSSVESTFNTGSQSCLRLRIVWVILK